MKNTVSKIVKFSSVVSVLAVGSIMSNQAIAATDGALGATSTGSVNLKVSKSAAARISGLQDFTVNNWLDTDGAVKLSDDVCVYSTKPNGAYTVKATGSGDSGAFTLAGPNSSTLAYAISWNAGGVGALSNTGTSLTAATTSAAFTKASRTSSNCTGATPGDTARIFFEVTKSALDAMVEGEYTGTLTLLVTPS